MNPELDHDRSLAYATAPTTEEALLLRCPDCRAACAWTGATRGGRLHDGVLRCAACRKERVVTDGVAHLYEERHVRGNDRLLRAIYDAVPALHDPLTTALTPLIAGITEHAGREHILRRMELDDIETPADRPVRILEVGIGGGANLAYFRDHLHGRRAEIWGVDLSRGMLRQCRKLVRKHGHTDVRLLMADGHALPFPDHTFDRVVSVGGIGGYRDPRTALAEMARVARPGTPIVVVDEQLDRGRTQGRLYRAVFRALTFYDRDPRCPTRLLPSGATDIVDEQPSRCYYCLTFRMRPTATGGAR
jgi:ubiquinone/menaquinone biosynthesis C-methylase UbiE